MLQLGLLRVITSPGSRFKKQRIKAQIICTHPLFVMFSKPKLSWSYVRPCLSFLRRFSTDGSDIDDLFWIGSHFCFCCETSCLIFVIPFFFAWTVSFLELQSVGCPSLVSLLFWFWLFGLFIYDFFFLMTACPFDCSEPSCLCSFCKDLFGAIRYALGSTERTTLPPGYDHGF